MTLLTALILDAALGEPRWIWTRLPHPAVLMGRAVAWCDRVLNHGTRQRARGVLALAVLLSLALATAGLLMALPLGPLPEILTCAILLAQRSLVEHVRAVASGLRRSLSDGRRAVAMIVSRDTSAMEAPAVARSAIESAAENLSDGVVAPAFWFAVAGLPGLIIYKIVNTADSMIGYRTPRHEAFGWATARLDDGLNWIPARLTAGLIALTTGQTRAGGAIARDAALHRSPNAGWPEAAMARALDVALAGPRSYDGTMRDFPFVHPEGRRDPGPEDINDAIGVLWRVWGVLVLGAAILAVV